jgi:Xaa-Pro aminopeptidase
MNEIQKVTIELKKINTDIAIITSNENATYLSGFEVPLYIGPMSCIANEMPLIVLIADASNNELIMIACEEYRALIEKNSLVKKIFYYTIFGNLKQVNTVNSFLEALDNAFKEIEINNSSKVSIGIEYQSCPFLILDRILKKFGHINPTEITGAFETARRIKTKREILLLKNAAKLLDLAQENFNDSKIKSGVSEFEIFDDALKAMKNQYGMLMPVTGELVVGKRTSEVKWPGGPLNSIISKGDSGIFDISPRIDGYWGDCSNVVVFGAKPDSNQKKYFNIVIEAFNAVLDVLKPGKQCFEIFNIIENCYKKYGFAVPHYCGHQIGVGVNELPRFVPFDKSFIETGMVFCLEIGLYEGKGGSTGARCEKMILITENGYELLNNFKWGMD